MAWGAVYMHWRSLFALSAWGACFGITHQSVLTKAVLPFTCNLHSSTAVVLQSSRYAERMRPDQAADITMSPLVSPRWSSSPLLHQITLGRIVSRRLNASSTCDSNCARLSFGS